MPCGEFELITQYFDRVKSLRSDVKKGIGDDCALLNIPEKHTLAISTDTLVEGVHFLPDIDPADLGYKALAVNLSDLAAMGATPAWLTLALTLPESDDLWLSAFSDSLFELLDSYQMQLIGGDTTRGPLSITIGVHGLIPDGCALLRSTARPGDSIYITGYPGESAAGLALLQNRLVIADAEVRDALLQRHLRPVPRVAQGLALRHLASAAIDVSDGLLADLHKLLNASHCGARIDLDNMPVSSLLRAHVSADQALQWILNGGEDYELCFTVPPEKCHELDQALRHLGVIYTCIGEVLPDSEGVKLWQGGASTTFNQQGFDHFDTR